MLRHRHTKMTVFEPLQWPVFRKTCELAAVPSTETPDAVEGINLVLGPLCGMNEMNEMCDDFTRKRLTKGTNLQKFMEYG